MQRSNWLNKYKNNNEGATAIEAAVIFPILITCLFAVFGMGSFMFGSHQAQRSVEETAREARVLDSPTEVELVALLKNNMKSAMFGSYEPAVSLIAQHGGNYAELNIVYTFQFDVPFLDMLKLNSVATTQVKIREMPV